MSFDFTAYNGPRSVAKIQADHRAEDERNRRAEEAKATKPQEAGVDAAAPARRTNTV